MIELTEFLSHFIEPRTTVSVSKELGISVTAILKRLKRYEKLGLVERVGETKTHFKGYYWRVTDKGKLLLKILTEKEEI